MTIALVGGIQRLERHYKNAAKNQRVNLLVYNGRPPKLEQRLKEVDGIVLFVGEVSHCAAKCARKIACDREMPIIYSRSSSLAALDKCIFKLKEEFRTSTRREPARSHRRGRVKARGGEEPS